MDVGEKMKRPPHPRASANFLSALTFSWFIPIFYRGYKKEMEVNDLFEPLKDHDSKLLGDRFEKEWKKELGKAKLKNRSPKLLSVLIKIFIVYNCFLGFILAILELGVLMLQPFLIGLLVRYFSSVNSELPEPSDEKATYIYRVPELFAEPTTKISQLEAVFFAGAISLDSLICSFMAHPYMMGTTHQGMQLRVGCCSLIYRKALRLSRTALGETTVGQVVNLLSNDVRRLDIAVLFLHYLWISPVEAILVSYFLYPIFGWSTFIGIFFLVAQIPLQVSLGKKSSFFRLRTAIRTDERIKFMNEIITGIQVIKMYAWEMPFAKLVDTARRREMKEVRGTYNIRSILFASHVASSRVAIFLTIAGHVLSGGEICAEKIFFLTAFYNLLRNAMTIYFPEAITEVAEAIISVQRLEQFLLYDEITPSILPSTKEFINGSSGEKPPQFEIKFDRASFKWCPDAEEPNLENLTLTVPSSGLLAVIGPVGSGKSTFVQAILREVPLSSGSFHVKGCISYASQEPWLFLGSIRQNILFGLPYNRQRYKRVIDVCALKADFEILPYGDKTMVGERGTSLSGGQRARINLARAVYKDADVYLLDDPLSAVDAHVGKHLFEDCISGYLRKKTVILVTHQLQYLTQCDHIIILNSGRVEAEGSFNKLQALGMDFAKLLHKNQGGDSDCQQKFSRRNSTSSSISHASEDERPDQKILDEAVIVGRLGWDVYVKYLQACKNWIYVFITFSLIILTQATCTSYDWWVSEWSAAEEYNLKSNMTSEERKEESFEKVSIYAGISSSVVFFAFTGTFLFFAMCRRISRYLHDDMFRRITGAPMKFFSENPSGRILNRFSKDIGSIDEILPETMLDCWQIFLNIFAIISICSVISPILLIPAIFIFGVAQLLRVVYLKSSRNIKRLEGVTRSPVFTQINATLQGLPTIRAFQAESILREDFDNHLNVHSAAWYLYIGSSRAFGSWLDMVCVTYIGAVSFVILFFVDSGAAAGLALTQSVELIATLQWGIRQFAEVENNMTSVERVVEYTQVEQEPARESLPAHKPPASWPTKGAIIFENVNLRYDPLEEPVLRGVSFTIRPREKVGIVGRTGAGKSSLIGALFRLAFIDGKISIDSVDTSTIGLHDLRSRVSIIPQEPVLFSGTLRKNLDPFEEFPDWCIWDALEEVELKETVSESAGGLHERMSEGGSNFSVGQRQLICLARAILRNNRILIMDEATANVDPRTDMLIQKTIRRKFTDCTVLTVAHRLNTVIDSDRILVMDSGSVAELDHPYLLLKDKGTILYGLVEQYGKDSAKKLYNLAKKNFKLKLRRDEALKLLEAAHEAAGDCSGSSRSSSPELPLLHVARL